LSPVTTEIGYRLSVFDRKPLGPTQPGYFFVVGVLMSTGVTIADREETASSALQAALVEYRRRPSWSRALAVNKTGHPVDVGCMLA